jgi:hypothetical protein
MCEAVGSEPLEKEMPIELQDLSVETQEVFELYNQLQAIWEGMSGTYIGKDQNLLPMLFDIYDTPLYIKKYALFIIPYIDMHVADDIARKMKSKIKVAGDK